MKYSAVLVTALISTAFAVPQSNAPTTTSTALTPQVSCIQKCPAGDVTCQAKCVGVAHPNESQANDTTKCAEKCDQGDGSPEATEKFSNCVQACIASYFPTSQTVGVGAPAQGSNAAKTTGATDSAGAKVTATNTGASGSATPTGTEASGSAASASSTGAASLNNVQVGAAGLAGLFMAIFAL